MCGPRGFGLAGVVGMLSFCVGQAGAYQCSTRGAYVVSLDLRSGSALDYVGTFTCSDQTTVDMKQGNSGGGEYHFESAASGYVGLRHGVWESDHGAASALSFKRASDQNYGTSYGSDYSCCSALSVPEQLCGGGLKIGGFYAFSYDSYRGNTLVESTLTPICTGDAFVCKNPGTFITSVLMNYYDAIYKIVSFTCTDGSITPVDVGSDGNLYHDSVTGGPFTALKTSYVGYFSHGDSGVSSGLQFKLSRAPYPYTSPFGNDYNPAHLTERACPPLSYINGLYLSQVFGTDTNGDAASFIASDIAPHCGCLSISNCVTQNSSDCKCTLCAPAYKIVNNGDGSATCAACPVISNCATYTSDCKCSACVTGYVVATDPATLITTCETPAVMKTCASGALITAVTVRSGDAIDEIVSFTCTGSQGSTEVPVGIGGTGAFQRVVTGGPFRGFQNAYFDRVDSGACAALSFMSSATSTYGTVFGKSSGVPVPKLCSESQNLIGLSISAVHYDVYDLVAQDISPICASITLAPTSSPTSAPSNAPTNPPTSTPTTPPTPVPSKAPTNAPTSVPSNASTSAPANSPTSSPSTGAPTATPTATAAPTSGSCPAGQYRDTATGTCGSSCPVGFFKDTTTGSCQECPNGGAAYKCDYGYYKLGTACDGTTTSFNQSCAQCVNHGPDYRYPVYQCSATSGFYMTGLACDGTGNSDTQACSACGYGAANYSCPSGYSKTGSACTSTSTYDSQTCAATTPAPTSPTPAPSNAPTNAPSSSPTNTPSKSPTQIQTQVPSTGSITPAPVTPVPSATATPTATSCKAGYYLSGGACAQCSSSTYHCAKYVTPAAGDTINCKCSGSCKAGYLLNANGYTCDVCSSSIYHCSKYIATTGTDPVCQCSGCKSGYGLTGTSCVACTSSHCSTYVTNSCDCTSCKSGYGLSGTKCAKCSSTYNCSTYISPATTNPICGCSVCNTGHTLSNGVCA